MTRVLGRIATRRVGALALAGMAAAGCARKKADVGAVQTAVVEPRDIVVTAQATGTVEPVDTVAVKPQASGLIVALPVEVGSEVKPGQLLAQIDTRNLRNDYERAAAAAQAAQSAVTVNNTALQRANELYAQKVITAVEHEAAVVNAANARSALVAAQTNLKTARQNLEYATVRAEVAGTVISKPASVGSVVSSATSTFGGGSTIVTIADLHRVRMRALVNETDVGNVHPGMPVTVTVDAFPNQQFPGQVEKVEPQAVIQNSVTMFPVLVSIRNSTLALLPGMNGEVSIVTQQRRGVLAVPNDALRSSRDAATAAAGLGLNPDSLRQMMMAQGGRTGSRGNGGASPGGEGAAPGGRGAGGPNPQRGSGGSGGQAGGAAGRGAPPIPVSDSICRTDSLRLAHTPGAQAQLDSLRAQMRMNGPDSTVRAAMTAIYARAHVSPDTMRACMRRSFGGGAGGAPGAGGFGGAGARSNNVAVAFVKQGSGWVPHRVRIGVSDFDYSEVLSGLQQGDVVALLSTVMVQAQRDQSQQRARQITGNGLPGSGGGGTRSSGGGGGGGGAGRPR